MEALKAWFQRYFSDPQVVFLAISLLVGLLLVIWFGSLMAPVIASVILAYLLEGLVRQMEHWRIPRLAAATLVFLLFLALLLFVMIAVVPMLVRQVTQLFQQLPVMIDEGQRLLEALPEQYPMFFSEDQIQQFMAGIGDELTLFRQEVLSRTLSFGVGLLTFMVYVVLMPILVFFMLKDKQAILAWFGRYLPSNRGLAAQVWTEVDEQVGNYIRGKIWEIMIVWVVTYITFSLLGLEYAMLMAALTGFSVLIPYIGATVVTLPVAAVAYFQWGLSPEMAWVLIAYGIIQFVDGNILVPILFSEVVNLHPVAIIVAILFFGGIWGFWGIFFAIPLATLVQAVLRAWPRQDQPETQPQAE